MIPFLNLVALVLHNSSHFEQLHAKKALLNPNLHLLIHRLTLLSISLRVSGQLG